MEADPVLQEDKEDGFVKKSEKVFFVIPVSEAHRESFLKNDSGQAGMTEKTATTCICHSRK